MTQMTDRLTTLTDEDLRQLGRLTTRDEAGTHFTTRHTDEWLARMEEAGAIIIARPVHAATGIPYGQDEWSVIVTQAAVEIGEAREWGAE